MVNQGARVVENKPVKALFLDRDGTINYDPGYIASPELLQLLPGAAAAIRKARDHGYLIAVVTNQSGVARKLIAPEMLPRIHDRMNELLRQEAGAFVDYFACCIHHPIDECDCRKPLPKLVFEAQEQLKVDLRLSAFIGDRLTDIRTGKSASVRHTVLVRTGNGLEAEARITEENRPDHIADDLGGAVEWLISQS